ncbi:cytochrome P450 [Hypomontagnella submonticulosa]|nr:cytochrome P450 [Hypomontagnella submonticulosa]
MGVTLTLIGLATYAVYFLVPCVLFLATYRIRFHPLKSFPGPLLAKLTDGYEGYQAICKRTHLDIFQNHIKYGPVVRYGPNRLLFNSATAVQDIYQNPNFTKSHVYVLSRLGGGSSIFSTIDKDQHRHKRQLYAQVLGSRSMRMFEPTILEHIDVFLAIILKSCNSSTPEDMTSRCQYMGFDTIASLALEQRLNLQTEEKNRVLLRVLIAAKTQANILMHLPAFRFVSSILRALPSPRTRQFRSTIKDMFMARKARGGNEQDLYSILSDPTATDVIENIVGEIVFFLTAGGTPPATTMCALFFYLCRYPECYKTLAHEIRSTFSSGGEIQSGPKLASCKYLRACIDESLRMNPPSLATLWREQAEDSHVPVTVEGHAVPRGTQVGVNVYALHHNEDYFPDPFKFKPERWIETSVSTAADDDVRPESQKAFVPFIVGPRACAGKSMVYLEVSLVLAKTLWYFDFETAPGPLGKVGEGETGRTDGRHRINEFQMLDVFNSHHRGPNLLFRTRGNFYSDLA